MPHPKPPPILSLRSTRSLGITVGAFAVTALSASNAQAAGYVSQYLDHVVTGDFDGDGYLDRAVADTSANTNAGQVTIYFGTEETSPGSNLPDTEMTSIHDDNNALVLTEDDPRFLWSAAAHRRFGSGLAAGDFDGDGADELVIGVPRAALAPATTLSGLAYVLYGSDIHDDESPAIPIYQGSSGGLGGMGIVSGVRENHDYFGEFAATGDFDCDGVDDLALGVPREDAAYWDQGVVHVLYGVAGAGLTTVGRGHYYQSSLGELNGLGDNFGAALATGRFHTGVGSCDDLAIGAPGDDVDGHAKAGAIHVMYGSLTGLSTNDDYIHQDVLGIEGWPTVNEEYGATLSAVHTSTASADLAVSSANGTCTGQGERRYQVLISGVGGAGSDSTDEFCSKHDPGITRSERGVLVEKSDAYGTWLQYIPSTADGNTEVFVIVHGTPGDPEQADARKATLDYAAYWRLIDIAESRNVMLVFPQMGPLFRGKAGEWSSRKNGDGYRQLVGMWIEADAWINEIIDGYLPVNLANVNEDGDARMYLWGHSAGGRYTGRYVLAHPDRLLSAVVGSAGNLPAIDWDLASQPAEWPNGSAPRDDYTRWYFSPACWWIDIDTQEKVELDPVGECIPGVVEDCCWVYNSQYVPDRDLWEQAAAGNLWVSVGADEDGWISEPYHEDLHYTCVEESECDEFHDKDREAKCPAPPMPTDHCVDNQCVQWHYDCHMYEATTYVDDLNDLAVSGTGDVELCSMPNTGHSSKASSAYVVDMLFNSSCSAYQG